ncbi:MAG: hypothetical protein U0930_14945 [Pirellulales bacterium]
MFTLLVLMMIGIQQDHNASEPGLFVNALTLLHDYGRKDCCLPGNDRALKADLAKALANDRQLAFDELDDWIEKATFSRIAGEDNLISEADISVACTKNQQLLRQSLLPKLKQHAELLTTSFDMIESTHYQSIERLADWIAENERNKRESHVIATCTGNSRRSILCASMGNLAATYYGLDKVRFYSGGTKPSAFNKRTIATLTEIGFQIESTGQEAPRGEPKTANPIYRIAWGNELQASEYSKTYFDTNNPQMGFAAIMACSEADAECPMIPGASLRLSMTFIDPKVYDDGAFEQAKYAEKRDDIGRTLMAAVALARVKTSR